MRAGVRVCLAVVGVLSGLLVGSGGLRAAPAELEIVATAAIVLDATDGSILYAKNADELRAPASLTKLATALTAVDLAPLDTTLRVTADDLVGEASMGLRPGDQLTLETALYGLLLASGNDAAMVIARNLSALPGDTPEMSVARFVRQMNLVAQRLGLQHTTFRNPHGLDEEGHVTTARDLALLTRAVLQRPELRRVLATPVYSDGRFMIQTTNRLMGRYPGLIGGKTGITDGAGYSLIEAAERDGHTLIVVVLGSTHEAWYDDAARLLDYGFARLAAVGAGSGSSEVPPVAPRTTAVTAPAAGSASALVLKVPASAREAEQAWFWPLSAASAAVATGGLLVGLPLFAAVFLARRQRAGAGQSRHLRHRRRVGHRAGASRLARPAADGRLGQPPVLAQRMLLETPRQESGVVQFDPAVAIAQRAVQAGRRGDYVVAEERFVEALRINPAFDLARTPEFWTLSPAGIVAAARAYRRVGRVRDARTLLTVAQISFGAVPVIREALAAFPCRGTEVPVAVLSLARSPRTPS
ncbi:MAG: D-alanyl-D-alanine carboxypeptidase [Thermomicrobium sp.]|nr:D-alanyl-D-alanine carboxypeptidase [Thermomicrobium sp.]